MANVKQVAWETFLNEENLMDGLEKRALNDENGTVIYRGGAETHQGVVPMFIILDDSDVATIRFIAGREVVTPSNQEALITFCNRENANVPLAKFYVEEMDHCVYLDLTYIASPSHFEPSTLFVLLRQLLEYLKEVGPKLDSAIKGDVPKA